MAIVKGVPNAQEIKNFEEGLYIEDYKTAPAKIKVVKINEEKGFTKDEALINAFYEKTRKGI